MIYCILSYIAGGKYCTSLGPIGFALNGVPIFNALTGEDTDAVLNEIFDNCKGHSSPNGAYHYHQFTGNYQLYCCNLSKANNNKVFPYLWYRVILS